jgi:hypothetical protein
MRRRVAGAGKAFSVGRLILGALVIVVALGATRPRAAAVLVVTVGEVTTGAFIADAQVRLPSIGRIERTKWNGEAIFTGVTDKRVRIQVRAIGYAPGDFETPITGDTTAVHFQLEKVTSTLDTVRVQSMRTDLHLAEYETRRRQGLGRFITDSVIAAEHAKGVKQLLVSHISGLRVNSLGGIVSMEPSPPNMSQGRGSMRRACLGGCCVAVYLDGFPLSSEIDLDHVDPEEIAGIESYSQTTAPVQYKPSLDYCKVILLWTKR